MKKRHKSLKLGTHEVYDRDDTGHYYIVKPTIPNSFCERRFYEAYLKSDWEVVDPRYEGPNIYPISSLAPDPSIATQERKINELVLIVNQLGKKLREGENQNG